MSYLPEGGYGLYSNFEDDDGFDFGDCQSPGDLDYEPVMTITKKPTNNNNINNGAATSDLATDKDVVAMDAPPPVSNASTIITDNDTEPKQNGFIVGGDSPPPSDKSKASHSVLRLMLSNHQLQHSRRPSSTSRADSLQIFHINQR